VGQRTLRLLNFFFLGVLRAFAVHPEVPPEPVEGLVEGFPINCLLLIGLSISFLILGIAQGEVWG
jgi:hypothetical protein